MKLGVAIGRRAGSLVAFEDRGQNSCISFDRHLERPPGTTPADHLRDLLKDLPPDLGKALLTLALSPGDLAMADAWPLPSRLGPSALAKAGPALVEARTAGEALEDLTIDFLEEEGVLQGVAIRTDLLSELQAAVRSAGLTLRLVTSLPAALGRAFPELPAVELTAGGERIRVSRSGGKVAWRSFPVEGPADSAPVRAYGLELAPQAALALGAALADPETVPDALAGTPEGRRSPLKRLRDPIVNVAAALALVLIALGIGFHREAARERAGHGSVAAAERELWTHLFPAESYKEGGLLGKVERRLAEAGETPGEPDFPSALAFWTEIARQMPDPEALGLTLESLDLAPDGGRLSARVPAVKDDVLRHAAALEGHLNRSEKLKTRGDFEVRDNQVNVRLRMDYRP